MATYYQSGTSDINSRPNLSEFLSENSTIYTNPTVSHMQEIQDSGSWRNQEDNETNNFAFPGMIWPAGQGLSLGLSSRIETSRDHNNEYETQVDSGFTRTIQNSKYLRLAQELLDETVNVQTALKQFRKRGDKIDEVKEMNTSSCGEVSEGERQELEKKLERLLSNLDEVDNRYKHQMQTLVSSFDVIAGCGAAKPYTDLAARTISNHFRCLRDTISGQILLIRKSLGGENDGKGVGTSTSRNVDQQIRQQRALQRLGVMQSQAWRPQRGLPDASVLILRTWLFEHFLHPYPKDSEKIMLARQTGLSRGQVSNWFINARVRLWKPMVEEIYKEECADTLEENDRSLSSENTPEVAAIGSSSSHRIQEPHLGSSSNHEHGHRQI